MVAFATVEEAVEDIRAGRMVVVVDDEDRENEGDLVMAASAVTPEAVNFMALHGRGLICVAMTDERLHALDLPMMVSTNTSLHQTAFCVSVDLRAPDRTGISAADRAATIAALCDPSTTPDDLARPGHVFPLRAQEGGVLMRRGHTEAAVDLVRLAGVGVTGVLCEILQPDGSMARRPELEAFAQHHRLKIVTIADLVAYRRRIEPVRRIAETALPSRYGDFTAVAYEVENGDPDYLALVLGDVAGADDVLVRIHSQCLTGDALGSLRCDCGEQLELAFDLIQREGQGVVIYIPGHEGRGIGLGQKIRAYALQERGCDTVEANLALGFPADLRSYGVAAHILAELDVRSVRLMTNNPAKRQGLSAHGVRVAEQVSLQVTPRPQNRAYLATKRERFNHDLDLLEEAAPDNVVPFVLPPVPTRVSTPAAPDLWQFDLAGI